MFGGMFPGFGAGGALGGFGGGTDADPMSWHTRVMPTLEGLKGQGVKGFLPLLLNAFGGGIEGLMGKMGEMGGLPGMGGGQTQAPQAPSMAAPRPPQPTASIPVPSFGGSPPGLNDILSRLHGGGRGRF